MKRTWVVVFRICCLWYLIQYDAFQFYPLSCNFHFSWRWEKNPLCLQHLLSSSPYCQFLLGDQQHFHSLLCLGIDDTAVATKKVYYCCSFVVVSILNVLIDCLMKGCRIYLVSFYIATGTDMSFSTSVD